MDTKNQAPSANPCHATQYPLTDAFLTRIAAIEPDARERFLARIVEGEEQNSSVANLPELEQQLATDPASRTLITAFCWGYDAVTDPTPAQQAEHDYWAAIHNTLCEQRDKPIAHKTQPSAKTPTLSHAYKTLARALAYIDIDIYMAYIDEIHALRTADEIHTLLTEEVELCPADFLSTSFHWEKSSAGFDYWADISRQLREA